MQQRPRVGDVREQLAHRLEQRVALALGLARGAGPEQGRDRLALGVVGVVEQGAQRLGPGLVGPQRLLRAAAHQGHAAGVAHVARELERQPRLAHAGVALDHDQAARAGGAGALGLAAHEHPGRAPVQQGRGGGPPRRATADRVVERARGRRRGDGEGAAQALAQLVVGHERPGAVARRDQPLDQVARGLLGERVEREPGPSQAHRLGRVAGALGHLGQDLGPAPALLVAGVAGPLVVQAREQLALAELQRLLEPAGRDQLREREGVDPGVL